MQAASTPTDVLIVFQVDLCLESVQEMWKIPSTKLKRANV